MYSKVMLVKSSCHWMQILQRHTSVTLTLALTLIKMFLHIQSHLEIKHIHG